MDKLIIKNPSEMKYNDREIFFNTNKGEVSMSLEDAWELAFCFFDATLSMDSNIEKMFELIDKKYKMGKF